MQQSMFVRGYVENCVVVIEFNEMNPWNIPYNALGSFISSLVINFTCSLQRLYLVNPSSLVLLGWKFAQKFLSEETVSKIAVIGRDQYSELLEYISKEQLERKYGGTRPNLSRFWPPVNTFRRTS